MLKRSALFLWLVACGSGASVTTKQPAPSPVTSAAVASAAVASVTVRLMPPPQKPAPPNPRLFAELPEIDPNRSYLSDARHLGFSSDDAYLGYEISTCDPCPSEFHFTSPTKSPLDFSYFRDPTNPHPEAAAKKQDAEVERNLRALGIEIGPHWRTLRGPFPYPDLVFAVTSDRNDVLGKVTLLFGARVDGYAPVFPLHVEIGPSSMFGTPMPATEQARVAKLPLAERNKELRDWAAQWLLSGPMLAYANVTRDGSDVGVVAVAVGSMWFEAANVGRMPARSFAAQVYNDTAMRFHLAAKFTQAATLFEKAEAANPNDSLFSYNLACAYAEAQDARAKDALLRAIQKDGEKIKARARSDKDFANVSNETWFRDLVR